MSTKKLKLKVFETIQNHRFPFTSADIGEMLAFHTNVKSKSQYDILLPKTLFQFSVFEHNID